MHYFLCITLDAGTKGLSEPVFRIRIILMRIRGSASGMMDPDPGSVLDPDSDPDPT